MNTTGIIGHRRQIRVLELLRNNGTVPNTMLFSGTPGIGKRLVARRFLMSLFCRDAEPPCLTCPVCRQAAGGTFPDILELRPDDKGSIPIGSTDRDEEGSVRWLIERLSKKSVSGRYGVLIDGAEAISDAGQNALLKTIEEPQAGAHIVILTANKSLILPTILSRCMDVSFNALTPAEVRQVLAAAGAAGDHELLAALSGGSVEIALIASDAAVLDGLAGLCGEIAAYLSQGTMLRLDFAPLLKKMTMEHLIAILLNRYRAVLESGISGTPLHPFFGADPVPDREKLTKIIKILLALRKGLSNNLNIRNTLKGMLYSMDRMDLVGLPKLGLSQ